jgi:CRISPR-associated endonuclease/helicase Cas3
MTATQPFIFAVNETHELAPIKILRKLPRRITFHQRIRQPMRIDQFCRDMNMLIRENKTKSILIELNTVSTANQVFRSLAASNNLFLLSSQIIPIHRRPLIDQIKASLERKVPVVLVTTQVIEAGVDLDFGIAVRDIGPIDSIVQTAGRCNRNGNRKDTDSPIFLYRIVDDQNHEYAKRVYGRVAIDISNNLLVTNTDVLTLVRSYYEEVQRRRSSQSSDDINTAISELNYEIVEDSFVLIDEEFKVPVFVEFDDDALRIWNRFVETNQPDTNRPDRSEIIQLRNEMEQYMIGVSRDHVQRLNLEETSGIFKINHTDIGILYDEITGFINP